MEKGELAAAQEHIEAAIAVRKEAQAKSEGHQPGSPAVSNREHIRDPDP